MCECYCLLSIIDHFRYLLFVVMMMMMMMMMMVMVMVMVMVMMMMMMIIIIIIIMIVVKQSTFCPNHFRFAGLVISLLIFDNFIDKY